MTEIGRVNKHKITHQDGGDDELVLTGILPGVHKTTHQDAGDDEIDATGLTGRVNFVDRGDPASYDFTITNFTTDNAWHDLDLSSIVPAGAKAIIIRASADCGILARLVYFRTKGNSNEINILYLGIYSVSVLNELTGILSVGADRKIQYKISSSDVTGLNTTIRGWFI